MASTLSDTLLSHQPHFGYCACCPNNAAPLLAPLLVERLRHVACELQAYAARARCRCRSVYVVFGSNCLCRRRMRLHPIGWLFKICLRSMLEWCKTNSMVASSNGCNTKRIDRNCRIAVDVVLLHKASAAFIDGALSRTSGIRCVIESIAMMATMLVEWSPSCEQAMASK